jgi:hypothetical protein
MRRSWFGASFTLLSAILLTFAQTHDAAPPSTPTNEVSHSSSHNRLGETHADYVGDEACRSCHKQKVEDFHVTAHYLTSRLPTKESILGNLASGQNVLRTSNPYLYFLMEQKGDAFFQTAVEGEPPYADSRRERFGLVVGSGGKGQTYLYWKGDRLFQLPVSYWRELGWVNSPGYRDGFANFERPIIPRCLECHGTYFKSTPNWPNSYDSSRFVVGITCEKCHGSGGRHVAEEDSKTARGASSACSIPDSSTAIANRISVPGAMLDMASALRRRSPTFQASRSKISLHSLRPIQIPRSTCTAIRSIS